MNTNTYTLKNKLVKKRNKNLQKKRIEFVNESIERFPSLKKKFSQWRKLFLKGEFISYKPSSFEYYYFTKYRTLFLMRYYGVQFLQKELGYSRYRIKFLHYQGCLFQLEQINKNFVFQTEEVTTYNLYHRLKRGFSRFLKLPRNVFQIETRWNLLPYKK